MGGGEGGGGCGGLEGCAADDVGRGRRRRLFGVLFWVGFRKFKVHNCVMSLCELRRRNKWESFNSLSRLNRIYHTPSPLVIYPSSPSPLLSPLSHFPNQPETHKPNHRPEVKLRTRMHSVNSFSCR